jgi:hypothetical protein
MGSRNEFSTSDPSSDRSVEPGYLDDESEMLKAIEESKKSAQEYEKRIKERYIYHSKNLHIMVFILTYDFDNSENDEVEKALRLSKEEEEKRLARLAEQNEKPLIDTSG